MGAESLVEGIRTRALLVLTTVAITDHRYLCPAHQAGHPEARVFPCQHDTIRLGIGVSRVG
jgi:hypothetical protein